jgi:hypothetical protein
MTELIKVRGLTRSGGGVRINKKKVTSTKTVAFDLDDTVTRRDLARHAAIGAIVVVGDLSTAIGSGVVTSAGTGYSYSVTAGTLKRENGADVTVAAVTNVAHTAADVTNPRIDVIHVDDADGTVAKTNGTAAATPNPPLTPAGKTAIAQVRVAAGATTAAGTTYTDVAPRL